MTRRQTASLILMLAASFAAACQEKPREETAATWRADCPPPEQPPPLSLEAGRAAHRVAAVRREIRQREAAAPGSFLRDMHDALDPATLASGSVCLTDVTDRGQFLFEHEYNFADGLGGGAKRPAGPFRRVHGGAFGGPETLACPSCHWIGGPNGAGAETDNAFLAGDGERFGSGDARNPPALIALGVVQALAAEMTLELQAQRDALLRDAARGGADREGRLSTKGIDFGALRATATGELDDSGVTGVDPDLVVRPFGWKGNFATIADFAGEALQVHMGIQSDPLLAKGVASQLGDGHDRADPDGDAVRRELGKGPFTALIVHLSLLELPIVDPLIQDQEMEPAAVALRAPTTTNFAGDFQRGREHFHALGCAGCHVPMMVLKNPVLKLDSAPPIDLSNAMRQPALAFDPTLGGYPVWLFSDLKRHDMGTANAGQHLQRGVGVRDYLTPRLWGVADSAPYLHDGRAPSFDYAIAGHDGEGAAARAAYAALSPEDQGALRVYLMSLRRASRVVVP